MRIWALASWLALFACGCSDGTASDQNPGAGAGAGASAGAGANGGGDAGGAPAAEVQLGVPGGKDGLDFVPLEAGAVLNLETFGQGGTHVLLGVRCIGFGSRAFVELRAKNLVDGTELVAPASVRPQLLFCEGDVCDLVPITMMMSGIAASGAERDGLPIELTANVHNVAGVSGTDSQQAVLSTQDL